MNADELVGTVDEVEIYNIMLRLKRIRQALNFTTEFVSSELQVSEERLRLGERQKLFLNYYTIARLAAFYDVSLDLLFYASSEQFDEEVEQMADITDILDNLNN